MKFSRRVALSLGLSTLCGGALLSLGIANGQPSPISTSPASSSGSAPSPVSTSPASSSGSAPSPISTSAAPSGASSSSRPVSSSIGGVSTASTSPTLKQTIGISPAQPAGQQVFSVFGGTGAGGASESYDLQSENVYSLLRERGAAVPNVLYPTSTARPSFIIERLIVLSISGAGNSSSGGGSAPSAPGSSSARAPGAPGGAAGGAAAAPKGPTDAERTVTDVRRVVEAEISRGSGRLGGDHLRKLRYLRSALVYLEQANQIGSAVAGAVGGAIPAGRSGNGQGDTKIDPREIFYGNARVAARRADSYAPRGF